MLTHHENRYLMLYVTFLFCKWYTLSAPYCFTLSPLLKFSHYYKYRCHLTSNNLICMMSLSVWILQWRHNGRDSVSNHQPHDCLLNHLFRRRSKKASKLCVTGLCVPGESPAQMASNAENGSIWWRHHEWPDDLLCDLHTKTFSREWLITLSPRLPVLYPSCL